MKTFRKKVTYKLVQILIFQTRRGLALGPTAGWGQSQAQAPPLWIPCSPLLLLSLHILRTSMSGLPLASSAGGRVRRGRKCAGWALAWDRADCEDVGTKYCTCGGRVQVAIKLPGGRLFLCPENIHCPRVFKLSPSSLLGQGNRGGVCRESKGRMTLFSHFSTAVKFQAGKVKTLPNNLCSCSHAASRGKATLGSGKGSRAHSERGSRRR